MTKIYMLTYIYIYIYIYIYTHIHLNGVWHEIDGRPRGEGGSLETDNVGQ